MMWLTKLIPKHGFSLFPVLSADAALSIGGCTHSHPSRIKHKCGYEVEKNQEFYDTFIYVCYKFISENEAFLVVFIQKPEI